ncbi:tRNA-U20-dihydrouridine synthase [Phaeovulum vinaykumarii]|uniref:tRNA-dihydrouridine synthase n=2 Tax=Phaeovulum vinaykumarii TaxID=407234 RepID=A0A1N7LM41_9RHOB|nr:tRNA-U20-dihydrouridine synthase [Phaeovulum vinaykumarii]SOC05351.1 tRNA-U20-dihydrouridine synthase [Phaeovulum vinaykumarii]
MAGITDVPFRRLVARFGAGLVVSEMVASGEMVTTRPSARAEARARADLGGETGVPVAVQLAGREAAPMAAAAALVADMGAAAIDINMGCPARKVTGGASGAALMRDPDHALRLIEAVVGAAAPRGVPVTLKMRLGWDDDSRNAPLIAARAVAAGVAMITVHGRTRMQFYGGQADWAAIAPVVAAVPVPVVANGDIRCGASARAARAQSGAAAVMVGRGACGAPWRLAQIAHAQGHAPAPVLPRGAELVDLIGEHYEDMLSHYGTKVGARVARKHLGWYAETLGGTALARRAELLRADDPAATRALIASAFAEAAVAPSDAASQAPDAGRVAA